MKKTITVLLLAFLLVSCNLPRPGSEATPEQTDSPVDAPTKTLPGPAQATATGQPGDLPGSSPTPTASMTLQPSLTQAASNTPDGTATLEPGIGSISGAILNYPFGAVPQLRIVAFEQEPPYHYWYWIPAAGSTSYLMDGYISTGRYQVVAYDPDGNKGGCVTIAVVRKDQTATCDITDWSGTYPDKPADVP